MSIKPTITKGLGALDPFAWKEMVAATEFIRQNRQRLTNLLAGEPGEGEQVGLSFLAKITDSSPMHGTGTAPNVYRWRYAWEKVKLTQSESSGNTITSVSTYAGGEAGALAGTIANANPSANPPVLATWALNLAEVGNTATLRMGYATDSATGSILDADAAPVVDWLVREVPDNTVVLMSAIRCVNGRLQYVFTHPNPINGVCPENAFINPGGGGGGEEGGELPI
jgi:hypothetical protein